MAKPTRKLSSKHKTRRAAPLKQSRLSRPIKSGGKPAPVSGQHPGVSKQDKVVAMLSSASGSTVPAIMQQTGWQQHSVRGFLAAVVRKRLKLRLASDKINGQRVYRIKSTGSKTSQSKRA